MVWGLGGGERGEFLFFCFSLMFLVKRDMMEKSEDIGVLFCILVRSWYFCFLRVKFLLLEELRLCFELFVIDIFGLLFDLMKILIRLLIII